MDVEEMCAKLEREAVEWEKDLKEHPNELLDPTIRSIIETIRGTIYDLRAKR